jgi:hypothetical protein
MVPEKKWRLHSSTLKFGPELFQTLFQRLSFSNTRFGKLFIYISLSNIIIHVLE